MEKLERENGSISGWLGFEFVERPELVEFRMSRPAQLQIGAVIVLALVTLIISIVVLTMK